MLLNVDSAWRRLADGLRPVAEHEEVELADALGRVAASDVSARIDLPPFDASAMDGYAVRSAALSRPGAKQFAVVDTSAAGHPARERVGAFEAIRIFTGAAMPDGADAVVVQEEVTRTGNVAETSVPVHAEQNVRRRGHDIRRGEKLCSAGDKLSAYRLAWLAACGIAGVSVARRVRVAIFSTGDELAEAGKPLREGQIYDSNRFALSCLLRQKAAEVVDLGCVADNPEAIRQTLRRAAESADLVVTSGGVSVGDADFVKAAVEQIGTIDFWRIALKPGKPLAVGSLQCEEREALFLGLPGNPVSTLVTYLLFVAPAVDVLAGGRPTPPLQLPALIDHDVRHSKGRREYMRGVFDVRQGRLHVATTGDQSSNRLATFANANCLVVIDEHRGSLRSGDEVQVIPLASEGGHLLHAPAITSLASVAAS